MDGVSIVACFYNSEKRFGKVLEHFDKQKVADSVKWEIVIVDNASTDNTSEKAKSC
jgi:glycosyltransferase involved in cell wall biosynthesis